MKQLPSGCSGPRQNAERLLHEALASYDAGRFADAERLYRAVLQERRDDPVASHNLGILVMQDGRIDAAVPLLKAALQADPSQGQFWLSYADALVRAGYAVAARQLPGQARRHGLDPRWSDAIEALLPAPADLPVAAMADLMRSYKAGHFAEAATAARALVLRFGDSPFAWKLLGAALQQLGQTADALDATQKAAALDTQDADIQFNLGLLLQAGGRPEEAEAAFSRALALDPRRVDAHGNLGCCLHGQGRLDEAERHFRRAIALRPEFAQAHFNLANVLQEQGRAAEAEAHFRRAVQIEPGLIDAHCNLANCLHTQGRLLDAEVACRQALLVDAGLAMIHGRLGTILFHLGRPAEAESAFRRAQELAPRNFGYAVRRHLLLPVIAASHEDLAAWRARYENGIAHLAQLAQDGFDFDASPARPLPNPTAFYLAYQNENDRPLLEALCRMFRAQVPDIGASAPHLPGWRAPQAGSRRIRVGFLSAHLGSGHTIGKLYQGLIDRLDPYHFEVVALHAHAGPAGDALPPPHGPGGRTLALPTGLAAQQAAVAALQLDVLFYPDIGMSPATYFLAYSRLAPVQAVSWGHPETTGLDSIDYFVSAAPIEPDDAEAHYTERLVRLNRLPCFYPPPALPGGVADRRALGLPEAGTLYACPQSLFKLHPDFDAVLAQIATGDPAAHIVLIESDVPGWADLLRKRWAGRQPILLERVIFLPLQPLDRFMVLLAQIDVLLDPLHFGSGNTLYEAMAFGTPVVTWPGRFMRGRIVAGAYRQMGIADAPVAARIEEYAPLALALGRDAERRRRLREASAAAATRTLFADVGAVREFEAFLQAAVQAAGRGETLPPGWRPGIKLGETA